MPSIGQCWSFDTNQFFACATGASTRKVASFPSKEDVMPSLRAPRFYNDDVLTSCLSGHLISQGSSDPPDVIMLIQQALNERGAALTVDGIFGPATAAAVTAYQTDKGLVPKDGIVGPGTMSAL